MERLTRKSEKGDYTTMGFIYMNKDTDCYKAVQRLADYEDIGTVEEFAKLKAENERQKEQLENSVPLPCKVGDTVYWRNGTELQRYKVLGFRYEKEEGLRVDLGEFVPLVNLFLGKNLFFNKAEAEAMQKQIRKQIRIHNVKTKIAKAEARLKELQKED